MKEWLASSLYLGFFISLGGYLAALFLKKKFASPLFSPPLISSLLTIGALLLFRMDYGTYMQSAGILDWLLTPATICLAIPLYRQIRLLKDNFAAIAAGVVSGVAACLGSIAALAWLFGFSHEQYVTLLPKSITTGIGIAISQEYGGIVPITVAVISMTGICGSMIASGVCRLFRITEPVARGLAIGTASHVIGTTRALEMGPVEGAMSSLATVVSGLLTVVLASFFVHLV